MARTYEISFKLGAQMAGNFAKTMTSASGTLGKLNNQIGNLNKQQASLNSLVKLRNQVAENSREFNKARERVATLAREIKNTENPSKELTREFERAKREVGNVKNRLSQKREELRQLNTTMGTTGQKTSDLVKRQSELARSAEKARSAQSGLQKTLAAQQANIQKRGELRGQLFDAAGLAVALGTPIKIAANFEQAMSKVGSISQATDEELAQLTATARSLGATTQWSASQAAEGMQYLSMAGFSTQQTISAMPGMLNLASAGAIDLGEAADIASNILSGFNMSADKTGKLGDVLTNTFTSSNTSLTQLGETMAYVAPVAEATGVSLEQTAAMAGKLGDAGIQGSKAGTALRAVISRLSAPSGEAATMLNELGIQTQDANGNLRDMPTILAEMDKAMRSMGSAARQEITSTVFGLEAASAATVLLGQAGSGQLQKYSQTLRETGSASRVAQKQNDNAAGAMKRLSSAAESIAITMGNVLLPTLAAGAERFASVIGVVDNLAQRFPLLTTVVVGGTAALIALRVATIAGGYAFTFVKGAVLSVVAVMKTLRVAYMLATGATVANTTASKSAIVISKAMTAAQWLFNAAMTANPIMLVVAGIAALIAAGIALYKNWDRVTAFFNAAWQKIKALFSAFSPLSWMMSGFNKLDGFLSNFSLYASGKKMLSTLASGIKSAVSVPVDAVKGALARVREFLPFSDAKVGPLSELTASGQSIMSTLSEGMAKFNASNMMKPFSQTASGLISGFKDGGIGGVARQLGSMLPSIGGGGQSITMQVTQHIAVGSGATGDVAQQARDGASQGADDLLNQMRAAMQREERLSYG